MGGSMAGWTVGQLMVSGCTVGRFLAGHLMVGGRGGVLMSWVGYPQQNPLGVGVGGPRVAPGVLGAGRGPWGGLGLGLLWTWWSDLGEGSNVGFLGWLWAWSHRWACPWGLWGCWGYQQPLPHAGAPGTLWVGTVWPRSARLHWDPSHAPPDGYDLVYGPPGAPHQVEMPPNTPKNQAPLGDPNTHPGTLITSLGTTPGNPNTSSRALTFLVGPQYPPRDPINPLGPQYSL